MQECNLYTCEASYIKTKEMAQSSHEIKHAISGGLLRSISVSAPEAAVLQPSRCLDTNVAATLKSQHYMIASLSRVQLAQATAQPAVDTYTLLHQHVARDLSLGSQ